MAPESFPSLPAQPPSPSSSLCCCCCWNWGACVRRHESPPPPALFPQQLDSPQQEEGLRQALDAVSQQLQKLSEIHWMVPVVAFAEEVGARGRGRSCLLALLSSRGAAPLLLLGVWGVGSGSSAARTVSRSLPFPGGGQSRRQLCRAQIGVGGRGRPTASALQAASLLLCAGPQPGDLQQRQQGQPQAADQPGQAEAGEGQGAAPEGQGWRPNAR